MKTEKSGEKEVSGNKTGKPTDALKRDEKLLKCWLEKKRQA